VGIHWWRIVKCFVRKITEENQGDKKTASGEYAFSLFLFGQFQSIETGVMNALQSSQVFLILHS
jgi:hypothetical protein